MKVTKRIQVDLQKPTLYPVVYAMQNDSNTREVEIALFSGGVSWEVPVDVTLAIAFKKQDGKSGLYDRLPNGDLAYSASSNLVSFVLVPEVLTVQGIVDVAVVFYDNNLNQLATFPFSVAVTENPSVGQSVSNNYYNFSTLADINEALENSVVRVDVEQEIPIHKQTQARRNIGAIGDGDSIGALEILNRLHVDREADIDFHDNPVKGVAAGEADTDAVNKKQLEDAEIGIIDKLCPAFTQSGNIVTCHPVEGYPLTVTAEAGATITRCGKNLFGGDALADKIASKGGTKDAANGTITFHPRDTGDLTLFNKFKENTQYSIILYGRSNYADSTYSNICIYYTDGTYDIRFRFTAPQADGYVTKVSEAGKTISRLSIRYMGGETCLYYNQFGVFEGAVTQEAFEPYNGENFAAGEKIPALPGINKLWADAGEITVSGREDPKASISRVTDRVSVLEETITALLEG